MSSLDAFLDRFVDAIVNPLISLLFGAAILMFLWGIAEFIRNSESEEKRLTGKK